ncbi:ATP-dependent DNA helicase PIF1 [Zea mays]|uniref:ATP-dependent DNA helicase n=1 Tax=Zea mays TaxID=4577 RepID=A0A3L6DB11_MAIZE|nr:ATP-dependent DNA helicase PIF1 [Zea mays]
MCSMFLDGDEKINVNQDDDSDWLHRNETFKANDVFTTRDLLTPGGEHETVGNTSNHNLEKTAYFRERYKNLTPAEREFRRERLRLYNSTPKRKGSKIEYIRKRRALLADTLSHESIAMESPTYTPEVVHPTTDAIEPDGSAVTPCDWVIPEIASNPFLPASTQTEDANSLHMSTGPLRRKQHVPHGERQSILARRNRQFEASISRNMATATDDTINNAGEGDDWTQPHMTAKINNNVQCRSQCHGAIVATNESASMTEQGSGVDHTQSKPRVISNVDDDDGVVFEDDADENEGYLFAGQYEDTDEDIEVDGSQDESTATDVPDPYDKVYSNIPEETHMLKTVPNCDYCTAKKFEFFNGHFSFTSLYCCLDSMTTNVRDSGIYTFRAQGMMYHNIKSFGRDGGAEQKHLELYFYDDDPTLEHRYRKCREEHQQKDKEVIRQIVDILRGNPYSEHLRTMGHVENLDDYRIALNLDQTLNQKTYNTPLTSEVAAVWIEGSEGRGQFSKSVMLHGKDSSSHCIRSYHGCYDALSYPLFFPRGELGWHTNIPKIRPGVFNPILHGKRLFQQFAVDTYIKIENSRLDYIRKNQDRLRADLYQGLVDSMLDGDIRGEKVGKRTVLSTSFIGGPRDMRCRYMDAMALVRKFGKPDIFLTMTCNPNWDEIRRELLPGQTPQDRSDLVVRVFHAKLQELKHRLTKQDILGKNHYPRPFSDTTLQGKDSYPIYRRRDDDRKEKVRGCELDNRWVVPYNPYRLHLFNCHINVEACGSIKAVKYLFKYIYKGHDRVSIVMRDASKADDDVEEIKQYRDARWVTPPEALWRIYGFELSQISPPVMQLQLHLPNMHMVAFHERQMVERVVNCPGVDRSMLTSYFEANRLHEEARGILYRDFPEWKRDTGGQVGRIVSAHPAEGERYYLRVLLNHVTGAASYVDLRTVDGVTLPTFREAAERRGLLESDNTLDECLTERALFQMPSSLLRLFATILVYCEPSDVAVLWQKHKDSMSEDYQHKSQNKTHVEQMVLIDIRNMLQSMGKDIKTFPLPPMIDTYDDAIGTTREVYEEESIQPTVEDVALKDSLNKEQRAAYDKIMSAVDTDQGGLFFVDGPGGTGKTYLYRVLLATLRNQGKIAVATATSGIAASIMPGGRTAHSRFKIPLTIDDGAVCSFTKQSGTAELLRKASLIIWDEASMTKRQAVEALDNSMRDIMGRPALPFGGKTIVFGGDFRQVLPVVRKGSRAQVVASSLRMSYLWESMSHLKLVSNMRAKNDPWFAEFLLRVGGGTEETNSDGDIRLPDDVCVPYSGSDNDLDNLIDFAFPNLNENMSDSTYITSRAILSTRNDWVDMINVKMIDRFQGEHMVYHSFDSAMDDPHNYYPPEFLNTLTPNGLPPHVLKLKIGCPVILLRNIDPANGLCNGTRLVVRGFQRNSIDAEIVLGQHVGKRIFLPRIPLCPSDEEMFPFQFKRKKFPVRLSFAMTVNKAQGQTIPNVGVYLPEPVFSHGQLYVALSRATARSNIKILVIPAVDWRKKSRKGVKKTPTVDCGTYTKNIVYKEEIPCEPRVEVVLIDDAFVERKWMECLFQPSAYLGDEVIDCYINLIKAQKHLKCRSGGRVHIENAFQFNFLKRDGDLEIKTEELYPIKDMAHICSVERRVLLYLDHDMVFIPINIREMHWYLAVIHARNMEIQVLDSLGTSQDRKDLTDSIKGLQRQIDMISQRKELKDHRWPDLQVASWPLREIDMGYAKQTDSSSCGLFLLNYIEYWTGDELSDSFTQDDMSHFRKKMATILLSSDLNKRRGCLLYKNEKEVDSGSPSDVEILENPTDSNKRKLLHVLDDSEVVYEDEEGPITQADLQRWFVDDWDKRAPVKVSTDGCTNDFLMVGLSTKDMPVTKADSIDVLCDYIMAIEDDTTLERTWVRSFNPFKIEISVKDLQNILTTTQDMILRCFDMAVRLLANKESRRLKEEIINNRKHYMDMHFWRMVGFGKLPKYHQDPTTEELAKTLDCWPSMNYYITGCRYVLMTWKFNGCHALFVIDHVKKHVTFIDFTPTQDWCKHMPYKRFAEAIIMASKKYKIAYSKKCSGWAEDIFKWEHTIQTGVPIDLRGFNTSYLVLQAMAMWGNDRRLKFVGVAQLYSGLVKVPHDVTGCMITARKRMLVTAGDMHSRYIPQQDYFSEGLYTFDIGQNDLAGEFYSRTEDEVIVSIPTILLEFENGLKAVISSRRLSNYLSTPEHHSSELNASADLLNHHFKRYTKVFARISSLAQKPDALQKGISPSDAAFTLGIAPALAKEHLLNAENKGKNPMGCTTRGSPLRWRLTEKFDWGILRHWLIKLDNDAIIVYSLKTLVCISRHYVP